MGGLMPEYCYITMWIDHSGIVIDGLVASAVVILQNAVVLLLTAICAVTDLHSGKIYNKLTYPAAVLGLLFGLLPGALLPAQRLAGLLVALLIFGLLRSLSGMGAGDVKLMAAIGAFKGAAFVCYSSIYIVCFACLIGLGVLAWQGRLLSSAKWVGGTLLAVVLPGLSRPVLQDGMTTMPFGPAIFLGTAYAIYLEYVYGAFTF
jgi:prepilin peptidase CpaA